MIAFVIFVLLSLLIYNISLYLLKLVAITHSLFNSKTKKFVDGRNGVLEELNSKFNGNSDEVVWFHCSSLGEFEMSRPLIERLKTNNSNLKIVITFFSPSGYEVRKNYSKAYYVCYLPYDSRHNAKQFLDIIRPSKVFFAKYDLWYYYLAECKSRYIKLYLFNANFISNQVFFKWYGILFRRMLSFFNTIFVINESSNKLLSEIEIENVVVAGDTRFDKVFQTIQEVKNIPEIEKFKEKSKLLVVGSSWKEDIDVLFPYLNSLNLKVVIAPHEINELNLSYVESKITKSVSRFSSIDCNVDFLIIDNVGMLSSIYKYADYAYVGGAFRSGLHNILEAATFGVPILFGPKYAKFPDAKELVKRKGVKSISNAIELEQTINKLLSSNTLRGKFSSISKSFVMENVGSTDKILKAIN